MQKQTKYIIFVMILISMIGVSIGYLAAGLFPHEAVISPHIEPLQQQSSPLVTCYTFRFEQSTIFLTSPVNTSIYNGAKTADKSVTIHGNVSENIWLKDSYLSMVNDPGQNDFYRDLIDTFRKIRNRGGLDDDEYLELMTVLVPLRYETSGQTPVKFPIETFVEGAGDCDDKSLLLAGLLSREGYKVALFLFGHESHMAVGVGADDYLYKNTGYAFIETTNLSFIGVPPQTLIGNETLQSNPIIIPVGTGRKIYHRGNETRYINENYRISDIKVHDLENQVKSKEPDLSAQQQQIGQLEAQIQHLKNAGNIREYNALVPTLNALVSDYNSRMATYRQIVARYQKYADAHNYILDHQYDRKGVYEYVRENIPG